MRIALAQLNFHVGNVEYNTNLMVSLTGEARRKGADLIIFSELSVCGYPPRDLLLSGVFVDRCMEGINKVACSCQGIAAIAGGPWPNKNTSGKQLYNTAFLLYEGTIQQMFHKGLLPTYDVFNEYRYFEPATEFHTVSLGGRKIALTVCEDVWNIGKGGLYRTDPPAILSSESPDMMVNISASPFAWDHRPERMRVLSENARRYKVPLFSANLVGGQTDLLFDGGSAVFNQKGALVDCLSLFEEDMRIYELQTVMEFAGTPLPDTPSGEGKWQLLKDALVMGIRDYFRKTGIRTALVGLSGGIDSAVTIMLAAEALGTENVRAALLPGPHSSTHSVIDAETLAIRAGIQYDTISINDTVRSLTKTLEPHFKNTKPGIAEENLQARARGVILMGLSNKNGYLLLNTSNKSEAAVGYSTLYGDMCGGLSVLGDVYKTDVYGLAKMINKNEEIIPENTIMKPPSAELKPGQRDSDTLPPYDVLDAILYRFLEQQKNITAITGEGFDGGLVRRVARMVFHSEYKRRQTPPILRVSMKCLGTGREMPLEACYDALLGDKP